MTDETTVAATAEVAPPPPPQPPVHTATFSDPDKRSKTVALAYPLVFDGKLYETIIVRRMTQAEIATFIEQSAGKEGDVRFPLFYDTDGNKVSDDLYAALDDDDAFALDTAAADFLPRRFRPVS